MIIRLLYCIAIAFNFILMIILAMTIALPIYIFTGRSLIAAFVESNNKIDEWYDNNKSL